MTLCRFLTLLQDLPRMAKLAAADFENVYLDKEPVVVSDGAAAWPAISK